MRIATVREIKPGEHRIGLTPRGVTALHGDGHDVLVEDGAVAEAHDLPYLDPATVLGVAA